MIRLAHLSDLHLTGGPLVPAWQLDSTATLAALLDAFEEDVDVAVLTGDLTDAGQPDGYRAAATMTRDPAAEVHTVPGNHDDPELMRELLGVDGAVRSVPLGAWTLVLLSSYQARRDAGLVDDASLDALDQHLADARGHVAVAVHHPPESTCPGPLCGMVNGPAVLARLAAAGNVRTVLSGHLHRRFATEHAGIQLARRPVDRRAARARARRGALPPPGHAAGRAPRRAARRLLGAGRSRRGPRVTPGGRLGNIRPLH